MPKIIRSAHFRADFLDISTYIGSESIDVALLFMSAVDEMIIQLSTMPEMAPRYPFEKSVLQDVRFFPVPGFPKHLIFYHPTKEGIKLLRLIHGARDIPSLF